MVTYLFPSNTGCEDFPKTDYWRKELLKERVCKCGYYQREYTLGRWLHKNCSIVFSLCVDNFGVKYTKEEDKKHLLDRLNKHYKVTADYKGTQYLGINLERDYKNRRVHISMPGYLTKAIK